MKSAIARLREEVATGGGLKPLRVMAASGQLGYGIPDAAFNAGLARKPHLIGADMGSIDPGPYYLGAGKMAQSETMVRVDLAKCLRGARQLGIPLLVGTAGSAGAAPHLAQTLDMVRAIAREENLHFRLASIAADMPREAVKRAIRAKRVVPLGEIGELTETDVDHATHLVGQMGIEAFQRALELGADVVIAGRACDSAVFAAVPATLGYPLGPTLHMSKIIECCSLCCTPGGRDTVIGTLEGDSFVIDSMNPTRHASPMSVAAHSLYEQADPYAVREPEGTLHTRDSRYEAVDEHRTRVAGSRWEPATQLTIKIEGAMRVGERAVLLCGSADPRVIANIKSITADVEKIVRELTPPRPDKPYQIFWRVYGIDAVFPWATPPDPLPREIFIMCECIADTAEEAKAVATVTKQYLLHHGFPGRLSTAGNTAIPFTPPEVAAATAYRFNVYHVMDVDALEPFFPVHMEDL
jgi:hypothetical protein